MAEQIPNWSEIFEAIDAELVSVLNNAGATAFQEVIAGEPHGLPLGGPFACYWYGGRVDSRSGGSTLGNVMYAARVIVECFWPIQVERTTLRALEADIAAIDTSIRREFRGNSAINSNLTDLYFTDSQLAFDDLPIVATDRFGFYRKLSMELHLENLEGEPIAA